MRLAWTVAIWVSVGSIVTGGRPWLARYCEMSAVASLALKVPGLVASAVLKKGPDSAPLTQAERGTRRKRARRATFLARIGGPLADVSPNWRCNASELWEVQGRRRGLCSREGNRLGLANDDRIRCQGPMGRRNRRL